MPPLSVMFKTVSTDCNLDCAYCYYRESLGGQRALRRLDLPLLERVIPAHMAYVADVGMASVSWQGGEPTLAGLPFFEQVVALQQAHARPGTVITNALQTNGVLLDDAWGTFLGHHRWLVGVSLDGPEAVHDALRRDRGGRGSFARVMRGIEVLRRHGVEFNILCVVGPHTAERAADLMAFFRIQGFSHVQFIPAMDFQATEPDRPAAFLVTPAQYGDFLVAAFEAWYQSGLPTVSIRTFDSLLQGLTGLPNELCVHADTCDAGVVIETDGSVYPCDFFIHPTWRLGSVFETPLAELMEHPARRAFIAGKRPLPAACAACEWLHACKGGCPRNRLTTSKETGPDYFCESYQRLFRHAGDRLDGLAATLRNKQRYLDLLQIAPASLDRTGRNDPCPCGSGRKHKACCANPAQARSYLFRA